MSSGSGDNSNGEIWSNRVQKELLALTTDNADMQSTEVRSMIPSYTTVKGHRLDLKKGICFLLIHVDVPVKSSSTGKETIVIVLDASLHLNADGSVNTTRPSYPFASPIARLKEGFQFFPKGSTIRNGDEIGIDLDWTPSLHLTDAILHIGLKIKESIVQKEPFHMASNDSNGPSSTTNSGGGKRGFGFSLGKATTSISKAFGTSSSSSSKQQSSSAAQRGSGTKPSRSTSGTGRGSGPATPKGAVTPSSASSSSPAMQSTSKNVQIGDEINLLDEPWVNAHGVYSCKAIRRPPFIEDAIEKAAKNTGTPANDNTPSGMLRSFANSTRSLIEESFLMVTETHIIELKASRLNVSSGIVSFCIPIDMMAKLKFRRQESLSLFFKSAPNDPLVYMCPDSGDAVHQIQSVLKRHGVRGKHTNAAAYKAISEAMHLVQAIQTKELALKHDPTVQRVNEIMDLYRQAAERFEVAGDIRHEEVVTHMRKFLALPQTISILDGSFQKPVGDSPTNRRRIVLGKNGIPEGEVLERHDAHLYDDDDYIDGLGAGQYVGNNTSKEEELENDKAFEQNIDQIIQDARSDFEKFKNLDDSSTLETDAMSDNYDNFAELDAMVREADKELDELLKA